MSTITTIQKQNIGNAGEYYVASLLSAHNFTATITLGRAERYDILAVSPTGRTYKFSIKTRFDEEATAFTLSENDENNPSDDLFYVLVRLHKFERTPEYWTIPSKEISQVIISAHKKWLEAKGKNGQAHNDTGMRKIPIEVRGADSNFYPKEWEEKLKQYHNNFNFLK